jgi:transcriptional regulator with XRE-family HTH domain
VHKKKFHIVVVNYKVNDQYCKAFGMHIRKLREERGIGMREFARQLDVEYTQIYRIEHGLINTTISMVLAIAEGLDVPVPALFDFQFISNK